MKRLTKVDGNGNWHIAGVEWGNIKGDLYGALCKLKGYEDTGLTPEEIMDGKLLTGWIPVSERLPELHRDVLVAVCDVNEDDASTFIDCLVDNNDRPTWSTYNGALDRVLAWMPLPDRYRP